MSEDVVKTSRNSKRRQAEILRLLQTRVRASVDELADEFNTTPQTIRKDLTTLAKVNQIYRFHGGASLIAGTEYTGFSVRSEIARDEKAAIASRVAEEIPNNATALINSGTTTAAVAERLEHHIGLTIVTDSVHLANNIRAFAGLEVVVPGGVVRRSDGAILGQEAVDFIRQFRVDIAVIGAAAIAPDGVLLDYDVREASVARAIIENSRRVLLAADSTKFGRAAPVCIGRLDQVDTLVTDAACPPELKLLCAETGTDLVLAS
jgi:DeoR family glycerol-3-phosphate regulon repressor